MRAHGQVTFNSWLGENTDFGGLVDPIKAVLFGGNVGHASVEIRLEKSEETKQFIQKLQDDKTKLKIEEIIDQSSGKVIYNIYFSFWPGDKKNYMNSSIDDRISERNGRELNANPGFEHDTVDAFFKDETDPFYTEVGHGHAREKLYSSPFFNTFGFGDHKHTAILPEAAKTRIFALLTKRIESLKNRVEREKFEEHIQTLESIQKKLSKQKIKKTELKIIADELTKEKDSLALRIKNEKLSPADLSSLKIQNDQLKQDLELIEPALIEEELIDRKIFSGAGVISHLILSTDLKTRMETMLEERIIELNDKLKQSESLLKSEADDTIIESIQEDNKTYAEELADYKSIQENLQEAIIDPFNLLVIFDELEKEMIKMKKKSETLNQSSPEYLVLKQQMKIAADDYKVIYSSLIRFRVLDVLEDQINICKQNITKGTAPEKKIANELLKDLNSLHKKVENKGLEDIHLIEPVILALKEQIEILEEKIEKEIDESKIEQYEDAIEVIQFDLEIIRNNYSVGLRPDSSFSSEGSFDGEYGFDLRTMILKMDEIAKSKTYDLRTYNCSDSAFDVFRAGVTEEMKTEIEDLKIAKKEIFNPIPIISTPATATARAAKIIELVEKLEHQRYLATQPFYLQVHHIIVDRLMKMIERTHNDTLALNLKQQLYAFIDLANNEKNKNGNGEVYMMASKEMLNQLQLMLNQDKKLSKKEIKKMKISLQEAEIKRARNQKVFAKDKTLLSDRLTTGNRLVTKIKSRLSKSKQNLELVVNNFFFTMKTSINKFRNWNNPAEISRLVRETKHLAERYFDPNTPNDLKTAMHAEFKEKFLLIKSYYVQYEKDGKIKNNTIANELGEKLKNLYLQYINSFNREFGHGVQRNEQLVIKQYDRIIKLTNDKIALEQNSHVIQVLQQFRSALDDYVSKNLTHLEDDKMLAHANVIAERLIAEHPTYLSLMALQSGLSELSKHEVLRAA